MKIVFAASEMVPFAKTGGLGDVLGALPRAIHNLGHEVLVFIPRYKCVSIKKWGLKTAIDRLEIPMGADKATVRVYSHTFEAGMMAYFIDQPDLFERDGLYGTGAGDYPDNDRRFILFQRAVLEALVKLRFKPDLIHCHDWQTGLIPVYLKSLYSKLTFFQKTKVAFTIHNLAYQGNFPPDSLPMTGLAWSQFRMERLEYYGKISFMKGGILDADLLTTVSKRYAREVQKKEFGCGLEAVLTSRSDRLHGIVNGIDYEEWDPQNDPDLDVHYSGADIEAKSKIKKSLQKADGLDVNPEAPLIGLISRLVDQKGIDILLPAIPELVSMGAQLVILGTGDEKYHKLLRDLAKKFKKSLSVHIVFDLKLAKRIYAGSDMFLVPSYYEPCGLGQMIAMRYGTVPVVRETGGLADTVTEFDAKRETGNGFSFREYTSDALIDMVERAVKVYKDKTSWHSLLNNLALCDFSWTASAKEYTELYKVTLSRKSKSF